MEFTFVNVCKLLSILILIPLVWMSWGEPNFLGYIVAFLAGFSIANFIPNGSSVSKLRPEDAEQIMSKLSDAQLQNILTPIQAGRKIEAIKALRAETALGLAESKNIVEYLMAQK